MADVEEMKARIEMLLQEYEAAIWDTGCFIEIMREDQERRMAGRGMARLGAAWAGRGNKEGEHGGK